MHNFVFWVIYFRILIHGLFFGMNVQVASLKMVRLLFEKGLLLDRLIAAGMDDELEQELVIRWCEIDLANRETNETKLCARSRKQNVIVIFIYYFGGILKFPENVKK